MNKIFAVVAALALLCLGSLAQASINIDTVYVGNAGNAGELSGAGAGGSGLNRICGSVGYNYNIGTYEVTAGQYAAFLNAAAKADPYTLYNASMSDPAYGCGITRSGAYGSYTYSVASDFFNRPVTYVNFWDSCRFANWLCNGQGSGSTETGAYTLNGYSGTNGRDIQRNAGWTWAVTSEDEWYKAAYYDPNKGGTGIGGYWNYPTGTDIAPGNDMADASGNNANYYNESGPYPIDSGKYLTVVGEFQNSQSAYGTFDQAGNVWEWNEVVVSGSHRGFRGGAFYTDDTTLQAATRYKLGGSCPFYTETSFLGFRVVQAVPEPSSFIALFGGLAGLFGIRRRSRAMANK